MNPPEELAATEFRFSHGNGEFYHGRFVHVCKGSLVCSQSYHRVSQESKIPARVSRGEELLTEDVQVSKRWLLHVPLKSYPGYSSRRPMPIAMNT